MTKYKITETGILMKAKNKEEIFLNWNEVQNITVKVTDEGPFTTDIWIVFKGKNKKIEIPQEAEVLDTEDLFGIFEKFKGFDFGKFIEAMSCTEKKEFLCWEK